MRDICHFAISKTITTTLGFVMKICFIASILLFILDLTKGQDISFLCLLKLEKEAAYDDRI